ncbi:MAG: hypothetical protein WD266_06815 [Balneolales bacterium]
MSQKKEEPPQKFSAFDEAADHGAMYDKLNIRNISFWTVLGLSVLVVVISGVIALYNYNKFRFQESASIQSEFAEFQEIRVNNLARLNTHGIVDQQEGIYHISIDSAITLMLEENEE